ncbi:hypothetical protein Drorol1_Dr00012421 [Drosera rotundifolia]
MRPFSTLWLYSILVLIMINAAGGFSPKRKIVIGGGIDGSSRLGREQQVAMKMAIIEYKSLCTNCSAELILDLWDSVPTLASTAMNIMNTIKIEALLFDLTLLEAALISDSNKNMTQVPFLSLAPTAISSPLVPQPHLNLIHMSTNIVVHMKCIAAIVGYFKWRQVTAIFEQSNVLALNHGFMTLLSDALKKVDATIDQSVIFPLMRSRGENTELIIDKELSKLKNNSNRVFVLVQCSLELAIYVFQQANQMGMVGKEYVWIISDEVASLIDSLNSSVVASMQGVLGYKTHFNEASPSITKFRIKFGQSYSLQYPQERNIISIFALRAYDATWAIAKAVGGGDSSSKSLLQNILVSNFSGLSGNISFRDGELAQSSTFEIINVFGKSYNCVAFWSQDTGFTKELPGQDYAAGKTRNETINLGPIIWPGGEVAVPKGWEFLPMVPLRIGVPASGAFRQFVNVSHENVTGFSFTGFSIEVFKAALKHLPYHLPYEFIPFSGDYDKMVYQIKQKVFDGVVGDTNILAKRSQWAEFTQPYVTSGINLVVPTKPDYPRDIWMFMEVFDAKLWLLIPSFSLFIGFVIWVIEQGVNPDFGTGSLSQQVGTTLWFSFTVLFFLQKESLKRNLSRVVLAPWVFLVLMLTASFTAVLTSKVTVSQLVPSAKDIEDLIRENAAIGCNRKSFTCDFLRNVLHVKPENVRNISSIDDYPEAFESGNIKAAIFVTAHAKVFLAEYCRGYKMTGPTYTFGGLGFAFQEGTSLVRDMSVAVLKAIENGEVFEFERQMLHSLNCNASGATTSKLGPRPFSVIFYLSGGVALVALLVTAIPMMVHHCKEALEKVKRFLWVHLLLIRSCSRPIIELAMQSSVGAQA